jgi:alpha-amylase
MGVIMQTFYWDCPVIESREHDWWLRIEEEVGALAAIGFSALWLPPAGKAASVKSMGYDPYDYFDLGEFDQKGGIGTWFGARSDLEKLIASCHAAGLQVYADFVLNHNSGGDLEERNPIDGQTRWTGFRPLSGRFLRDWQSFHPSRYETADAMSFGDMPDLCHRNPQVYTGLLECAEWLINEVGYDGFRYDFVKGYGSWMVRAIQELRGLHGDVSFKPFAVGECWDGVRTIDDWLADVNAFSDNPVAAFDFPLRWNLQALCDQYGFSLRSLTQDTVLANNPALAVTFVENHDVVRDSPIVHDKMLAYAVILTHPGYPCVFWQDYFNWNLGRPGAANGIAALVSLHETHAGGDLQVLWQDDDLYIIQRKGFGAQRGLVLVLNNRGEWHGTSVRTQWSDTPFTPAAWCSARDPAEPLAKHTDLAGWSDFWAPPRGYVVYLPQA